MHKIHRNTHENCLYVLSHSSAPKTLVLNHTFSWISFYRSHIEIIQCAFFHSTHTHARTHGLGYGWSDWLAQYANAEVNLISPRSFEIQSECQAISTNKYKYEVKHRQGITLNILCVCITIHSKYYGIYYTPYDGDVPILPMSNLGNKFDKHYATLYFWCSCCCLSVALLFSINKRMFAV